MSDALIAADVIVRLADIVEGDRLVDATIRLVETLA